MYKAFIFPLLVFLISICSLNSKEPNIITVPLNVIYNSFEKYPIKRHTTLVMEKEVEIQTPFGKQIRRLKETYTGQIEILESSLFASNITIGTDQNFNVILDTGSVNLWVPKVGSKDQHEIENHYDPDKSQTKVKTTDTFEIKYGTGSTKGVFYTDYVNFIKGSFNIKFGVADETVFDVKGADGIVGLAKKYTDNIYSTIWTLKSKNLISTKSFSLKYFDDTKSVEMYIGDEHSDFQNDEGTAQCQLLHQTTYDNLLWTCKLYTFGLISQDGSKNITSSCGYNFLFDTGSNVMMLPMETLNNLLNQLSGFNCAKGTTDNGVQIICSDKNNLPDMFIEVGNHYLILDHNEVFYKFTENNVVKYVLNAVFKEDITISLIGQPFFRLFHTKFDPDNGLLKFYTKNLNSLRKASEKPDDDTARSFEPINADPNGWINEDTMKIIAAVAIVIALLFVICCIVRCCKKTMRKKSNKI